MPNPTEFFNWYITDERTGERRLTTYKLSRPDAERAFPGAEPDLQRARSATCRVQVKRLRTADREEGGPDVERRLDSGAKA
jgi:hypothetical protein